MAIETVADLSNASLRCNTPALRNNMDDIVEAISREALPTLQTELEGLIRDQYLRRANT